MFYNYTCSCCNCVLPASAFTKFSYLLLSHVKEAMLVEGVVLLTVFANTVQCGCPPWFVPDANTTGCVCGKHLNEVVKCDECTQESLLKLGYCMTFDIGLERPVVGGCPYPRFHDIADPDFLYVVLPSNETN